MIDLLLDIVSTLVGIPIGTDWQEKARARRTARALAAGQQAVIPGWVLGAKPYCRAQGGFLVVTPTALHYDADRGMPLTRREVPVDRLVVRDRSLGTRDDHKRMPPDWDVLDCLDGEVGVLIACHRREMPYVEQLFRRSS